MAESLIPKKDLNVTSEKVISALGYTPLPDDTVIPPDTSGMISDAYSASKTYAVGDYCISGNSLWRCKIACAGETPVEGTYWTKKIVSGELTDVYSLLGNKVSKNDFEVRNLVKVDSSQDGKPWEVLKSAFQDMPVGKICVGNIAANSAHKYIGSRQINNFGGFIVFGYYYMYFVSCEGGNWRYKKIETDTNF